MSYADDIVSQDMQETAMARISHESRNCMCCDCFARRPHEYPCNKCAGLSQWRPKGMTLTQWKKMQKETREERKMNEERVVMVRFERENGGWSGEYAFKTLLDLHEGDDVIVDVTNKGATLARVSKVDVDDKRAARWVIQKVDYTEHKARVVREAKLQALLERMEKRVHKLQKYEIYAKWAENDPEMATLVAEYNLLVSGL